MSNKPRFRIRRGEKYNDVEELRRLNKLVQNKQSRLRTNKDVESVGVNTRRIDTFDSRDDFNRYKKNMEKFLDRDANFFVQNEQGAMMEYKELQQLERTIKRVNRGKKKQWDSFKDLPFTHRGIDTGLTVKEVADPKIGIGDPRFDEYKPLKWDPSKWRNTAEFEKEFDKRMKLYEGDWLKRKNEMYRDNYLKAIENKLGVWGKDLHTKIKGMDLDEFIQKYHTENNANIDFLYDKLDIDAKVQELEKVW